MNKAVPTLRLILSSAPVGVSGALRLYIAFLFAGLPPDLLLCTAAGLVIYATYTLDRSLSCAEDAINQARLLGANRMVALGVCGVTFLGGFLLFARGDLYFIPMYPLVIGMLYTRGISWGSFSLKLKGSAGGKNLVIGLTWGGAIALVIFEQGAGWAVAGAIFFFYSVKLFLNSVVYDMKDLEGDRIAGIRTLPAILGERCVRHLLLGLAFLLHAGMALAILQRVIRPELLILSYSFLVILPFVCWYSAGKEAKMTGIRRHLRVIVIDGESAIALVLRFLTGWGSAAIAPGFG